MCSIFGFAGYVREGDWRQTHDLLTALFLESMARGKDASGFAACPSPLHGHGRIGAVTSKSPLAANLFVRCDEAWTRLHHRRCAALIGHTRWATHGSPFDNANNHPFSDGQTYLVHNGILSQHVETADRLGLQLTTQCDSELLMRVVASYDHPSDGLDACLRQCKGSMAIAVLDAVQQRVLLARNSGRSIYLLRLTRDRRTFFASTAEILLDSFHDVLGRSVDRQIDLLMPLADGAVHVLEADGRVRS